MISVLLSRLVLLVFGTLYPAYASYKTVKTKNVRDYVKWMMYWIVFALYTTIEIFADILIAFWCPFYYELKILFVLWLICPATRGSTYIFRKIIHPNLSRNEVMIDSYVASLVDHGYDIARRMGAQGMDFLVEFILELFRKGQVTAANFLPKIAELAQKESVIAQSEVDAPKERNADEEFDMLTMENPDTCDPPVSSSTRRNSQKSPRVSDTGSASESEERSSSKSRPRKVLKTKTKVTTVRERKKKVLK